MSHKGMALVIVGLVIVGIPMVAFIWETINQALALEVELERVMLTIPILVLFVGFLVIAGRLVSKSFGNRQDSADL